MTTVTSQDQYMPSEVTTVPIDQVYTADNASTSENANTASSQVQADSDATGASYGPVSYSPQLGSEGVSMVIQPTVNKMGNPKGGLTSSAISWAALLPAAIILGAGALWLYTRRRNRSWYRGWY